MVKDLCSKHGFSDAPFYNWRSRYGGMEVADVRRLRELEGENAKRKKLLAEAMFDIGALKVVTSVKTVSPQGTQGIRASHAGKDRGSQSDGHAS